MADASTTNPVRAVHPPRFAASRRLCRSPAPVPSENMALGQLAAEPANLRATGSGDMPGPTAPEDQPLSRDCDGVIYGER